VHESVTELFDYYAGSAPLLISIPHDGRLVPQPIAERMTKRARELPDTDWHVGRLYEFAKDLGASVIAATHSRYIVDLNRASTDEVLYQGQFVTGLCPVKMFDGGDIYLPGEAVRDEEKEQRVENYWQPYHDKVVSTLDEIMATHGYALLWDAHSIPSRVPLLFDDELPVLNFGTNDGQSCANDVIDAVVAEARVFEEYSMVLDGRFKGGFITRQYGDPANDVHAIQLELAQRCYMIEESWSFNNDRASRMQNALSKLLQTYVRSAASHHEGLE
jgi:N-formylglutamate amidohydrolase